MLNRGLGDCVDPMSESPLSRYFTRRDEGETSLPLLGGPSRIFEVVRVVPVSHSHLEQKCGMGRLILSVLILQGTGMCPQH